ncbi:MAG: N-methyl-L-tryptophan oxidase, partial [Acidimicrobiales bacterium]|nr:N-methyl-L-tryptophan oxidase [Acidimicrobiales bacterium]
RGVSVVGIEQFSPGHDRGSSHGNSRLFRVACLEHPNLVTLARTSRDLWRELESLSGQPLLTTTGSITIGSPSSPEVRDALLAAGQHNLDVERLTDAEVATRYPHHADIASSHVGVVDPEAGILRPEAAIVAAVDAARHAGAHVITETRITGVAVTDGGVTIETPTGKINARQAVVTAGAWLGSLAPGLPLRSRRVMQSWFDPKSSADRSIDLSDFPVFIRALDDGTSYWGHGQTHGEGAKIGVDWDPDCRWTEPDELDRDVSPIDYKLVSSLVRDWLPDLDPNPTKVTPCMVTYTPDHQFFIGRLDNDSPIIVGGGGSGHAFKHAAGIGELIAQITQREKPLFDTSFVSPTRTLPDSL